MKMERVRKVSRLTARRSCCVHTSVVSVPFSVTPCSLWELTGTTQGAWCSCIEVMMGSKLTF